MWKRPVSAPPATASAGHADSSPAADQAHGRSGGVGSRGVHIAGDVHGSGPGITIGAATGDHLTIGTAPPGPAAEPGRPR